MMDRNREVRRGSMAAVNGGLRRRQQRSTNLRDSPEEDGAMEMQETSRLRDRDRDRDRVSKKDRDRDRDRSSSRSKRRRGERLMHGRDEGDDSSDESMDDEDDDEDEDATVSVRLPASSAANPPPPPSSSSSMQLQQQNQHVRKNFPVKPARPPAPAWKVAEEMIGVSIPRKARSSSLKRSQECFSGVGGGGGSGELMHRQSSTSPARPSPSSNTAVSPPSSSNAPIRKKKQISGSKQHRPPTKISKSSPSSEIEIEVAEVLFGMTRQSLPSSSSAPSSSSSRPEAHQKLDTKEINGLSSEAKLRISSPVSFSPPPSALPCNNNIATLAATAPKRKRPRLKFDEESPTSPSPKAEAELPSKMDAPASVPASPLRSEKKMAAASPAVENGNALADVGDHKQVLAELEGCNHSPEPKEVKQEIAAATSKSKEASCSDLDFNLEESTVAKADQAPVADSPREEKFSIDLMAPPPVPSGNSERDGLSEYAADHKSLEMKLDTVNGEMEQDKASKLEAMETASVEVRSTGKSIANVVDIKKHAAKERPKLDLQLDLEKQDKDSLSLSCGSKYQQQVKQQSKAPKIDPKLEKSAHPASLPLTMPLAGWPGPGNFPHFGYMGHVPSVPAVMPIDGTSATSKTMQTPHFFPPQKPKRCATHCYIAQTIYYNQQIARMNSFWPPAAAAAAAAAAVGTAPLYGAKQYNLNVMPPSEAAIHGNPLQGGFPGRSLGLLPDKASPAVAMTYTGPPAKEKSLVAVASAAATANNTFMEAAQRKQFLLPQTPSQAGSSAAPPNMIHSPAAFIFPISQQPAAAAATRSAGSKSTPGIGNVAPPATSASSAAPGSTPAVYPPPTMNFNYAGMPPNDAQYLAILQNNAYPFPMPAHVGGGPPPYRGANPSQAMSFYNGSFYSSPMMHPSSQQHLRQHQQLVANQQPPPQSQQGHQNTSTSSGSSSSQKHHSKRVPGGGAAPSATATGGNSHNFPGSKQHLHLLPPQARQLESEAGCEDSPSTADSSRVSTPAQKGIYGPNFAMSIHPQNFALISPAAAAALPGSGAAGGGSSHNEKQLAVNQQAYSMSFVPFGGPAAAGAPGLDFSSMMQNHALCQGLPEAARHHGYQQITASATAAHAHQHRKPHHEDRKSGDSATMNANVACEEGKMMTSAAGKAAGSGAQHSLSFSRPDNDPPSGILGSSSNITEGPSRTLNLIQPPANNGGRVTSRPSSAAPASNSSAAIASNPSTSSPHMQPTQQQQQHLVQLQRQQQQQVQQQMQFQQQMSSRAVKSSSHNTNNAAMYSDRMPPGSPMARFPQVGLASFPPSVIQGASPQWKGSGRAATPGPSTSATSSSSSAKNQLPQQQQQQQGRAQQQQPLLSSNQHQTHISFGVSASKGVGVMGQPHLAGGSSNSSLTSVAAAAMAAGSPQNSATKSSPGNGGGGNGGNGSPRASSSSKSGPPPATLLSPMLPLQQQVQNAKNSPSSLSSNIKSSPANNRNMTSILGHPHINAASNSNSSTKFQQQAQQQQQQQQQKQQSFHQPQLFFSNPYVQAAQSAQSNAAAATASFYQQQQQQRRQSEQQSQQQQNSTNTGVLSLCPSTLTLTGSSAPSDPAKAAASASAGSMKGLTPTPVERSGVLQHGAQFSSSSMVQHPLISATSFPYMHTMVSSVSVKPASDPKAATGGDNLHWKPEKR